MLAKSNKSMTVFFSVTSFLYAVLSIIRNIANLIYDTLYRKEGMFYIILNLLNAFLLVVIGSFLAKKYSDTYGKKANSKKTKTDNLVLFILSALIFCKYICLYITDISKYSNFYFGNNQGFCLWVVFISVVINSGLQATFFALDYFAKNETKKRVFNWLCWIPIITIVFNFAVSVFGLYGMPDSILLIPDVLFWVSMGLYFNSCYSEKNLIKPFRYYYENYDLLGGAPRIKNLFLKKCKGIISEDEYNVRKAQIIGKFPQGTTAEIVLNEFYSGLKEKTKNNLKEKKEESKVFVKLISVFVIAGVVITATSYSFPYITKEYTVPFSKYVCASANMLFKNYEKAYDIYANIEGFMDSEEKSKKAALFFADECFDNKDFQTAANYYKYSDGYSNSDDKYKEASYESGKKYLKSNNYKKAIEAFSEAGSFNDSKTLFQKSNYLYGKELMKKEKFYNASECFENATTYKDAENLKKEATYKRGIQTYKKGSYNLAISVFEDLSHYKESDTYIKKCKYAFVKENYYNSNATTYRYLKDLKALNYSDSKYLYDDLYSWKVKLTCANTSYDDDYTCSKRISKYCSFFHIRFLVTGGTPYEATDFGYTEYWPSGETDTSYDYWENITDGQTCSVTWRDGIYENPTSTSPTGNFYIKIFERFSGQTIGTFTFEVY